MRAPSGSGTAPTAKIVPLDRLVRDSWPVLVHVAERTLRSGWREGADTAEDVIQRVLLRVLRDPERLLPDNLPHARRIQRLVKAVRYEGMHARRDTARRWILEQEAVRCGSILRRQSPSDEEACVKDIRTLLTDDGLLTPAERRVATEMLLDGWTPAEVARNQSKIPQTIRELWRRGREKLRRVMVREGWNAQAV